MPDPAVRVALLARAGDARDQLRRALSESGADVVAEGDPAELDPGTVAGRQPGVVVVSLEPAIEDALAEFEDLLAMPGVQVIYDDAEVTGKLDGWDLARWARHLAAKLAGSEAVLPPAPADAAPHEPDAGLSLVPGAPPTPAEEMDHHRLEDYAAESLDLSDWVPSTPSLTDVEVAGAADLGDAGTAAGDDAAAIAEMDLGLDLADLELAMTPLSDDDLADAGSLRAETTESGDFADLGDLDAMDLSLDSMDIALDEIPTGGNDLAVDADDVDAVALDEAPLLADFELSDEPVRFSSFTDDDVPAADGLDDDVAALAAHLDAYQAGVPADVPAEPDFSIAPPERPRPASVAEATALAAEEAGARGTAGGFGNLELVPLDASAPAPAAEDAPAHDAPAASRTLHLADADTVGNNATAVGALLVFAGLGGPDGVRQLLSALPPTLPVPVLLYQHLDTGKHQRLVGQLSKASRLPLDLAAEGKLAYAGRVAVLQPGTGVARHDNVFRFVSGSDLSGVVAALPAADSVVLVLSGGDPNVVPAVLASQAAGAQVLVQDPSTCFDATAAETLIAAGAATASLPELARIIIDRWS